MSRSRIFSAMLAVIALPPAALAGDTTKTAPDTPVAPPPKAALPATQPNDDKGSADTRRPAGSTQMPIDRSAQPINPADPRVAVPEAPKGPGNPKPDAAD